MGRERLASASVAGESIWVGTYFGLGSIFMGRVAALGASLGETADMLSAAAVAVLTGRAFRRAARLHGSE
jgi:hypothetical protein